MSVEGYRVPEPGYKDYVRPIPSTWWLRYRPYFLFMLRELTAVFVFLFTIHLLMGVVALSQSEFAWNAWSARASGSRPMALVGFITFFFVMYHVITWFRAGAVVAPIAIGEFKVKPWMFVLGNLGLVAVVVVIIGYFTLGG